MKQKKESKTIVVGLDLSLTSTGVVVLHNDKIVEQKVVRSSPVGPLPVDEAKRLNTISEQVLALVPDTAELVAIEGIGFSISKTTAIAQLAAINYITRIGLMKRGISFVIVYPTTLKKFITEKGNSQKDLVMLEIYKQYGHSLTDNNIADAFVLATIGQSLLGKPTKKPTQRQDEVIKLLKKQIDEKK